MTAGPLRVAYVCVWDPDYPRNRRIRHWLQAADDVEVTVFRRSTRRPKAVRLVADVLGPVWQLRHFDVVVVAEYAVNFAPFIALAARLTGRRVVVDGFVSKYETMVEDWGRHAPTSFTARAYALVDRLAARLPHVYLTDTDVRADGVRQRHGHRVGALALPVGAPAWARPRPRPIDDEPDVLRVLFYGLYVPLHGLETIVRAAAVLQSRTPDRVRFTFVGDGVLRPRTEASVRELGLDGVCTFRDPVPEEQLAEVIAAHDVVLGVFGGSDQARTVIPNKVWQGLACGRVVVTRQSPALVEIAPLVGDQLVTVPAEDPEALAEALGRVRVRGSAVPASDDTAGRLERHVEVRFAALLAAIDPGRARTALTTARRP